jgi:hypothetical protein
MDKNSQIRQMLINGLTEDEFIERFEEIMEFSGFKKFEPYTPGDNGHLARLVKVSMPEYLERIHRMNVTKNSWADINNISDRLKLFLSLRGENI